MHILLISDIRPIGTLQWYVKFILYYLNYITEKDHPKIDPKVLERYLTLAKDYFSNPDAYDQAEKKRR